MYISNIHQVSRFHPGKKNGYFAFAVQFCIKKMALRLGDKI